MTVDAGKLSFLDTLVKLRKMTSSYVMSVCMEQVGSCVSTRFCECFL